MTDRFSTFVVSALVDTITGGAARVVGAPPPHRSVQVCPFTGELDDCHTIKKFGHHVPSAAGHARYGDDHSLARLLGSLDRGENAVPVAVRLEGAADQINGGAIGHPLKGGLLQAPSRT